MQVQLGIARGSERSGFTPSEVVALDKKPSYLATPSPAMSWRRRSRGIVAVAVLPVQFGINRVRDVLHGAIAVGHVEAAVVCAAEFPEVVITLGILLRR